MSSRRRALGALAGAAVLPRFAVAQAWPARPVKFLVPYGAGNLADQVGRVLAEHLSRTWQQPVVVENVAGAGGSIGVAQLARATPDGYTIGIAAIAALAVTPHLQKTAYDPLNDLRPICGAAISSGGVLVVNAALGVKTLDELIRLARSRRDKPLLYYSPGNGTIPHLTMEILSRALDFPVSHVPYRTAMAGATDLMSGQVDLAIDSLSVQRPGVDSGKVRVLFTSNATRLPQLPAVPTLRELAPSVELPHAWMSIQGPRAMPAPIADRIAADVLAHVGSAEFASKMPPGVEPMPIDQAAVATRVRAEHRQFGKVVAELGLGKS